MKLKKTLSIVMAATLSIFTIAGCSEQGKNYSKELNNLTKWEATSSEFTGEMSIEANGENENFTFSGTSYMKGQTQGHMNFKFNSKSGKINIPELDMYLDNGISYISKNYYTQNFTLNGIEAPKSISNISADYIGIDSGLDMNSLIELTKSPDYLSNLSTQLFGKNNDVEIPMKQNGREYSVNMDSDQIVDLVSKGISGLSENLDNSNSTFKLGLNEEMIKTLKEGVKDPSFKTMLEQAKPMLNGSNISTKEKFTDDSYTAEFNMNVQIAGMAKINIKVNSTSKKAEVKDVSMPVNRVTFTQEQFMNMMIPEDTQAK
ncbi:MULTISPECIES: hypothetical protein [Clostridium]|uniref:Lipoprotein n=1 Tax=Clostridium aquiflavi TaxID=3073603 RepID=A0ABU1EKN2_9CLOT|nr:MULTISPECIES: hypothetical protein [unclassified Clostridium]MDR5588950.1 hypothetical protein [Clostridium sp. 5N-1]NFG63494.1 hypothetical protein [Clostridium botulinum]NFQ08109.1 hypothetical protein [Clostridium botulinum]